MRNLCYDNHEHSINTDSMLGRIFVLSAIWKGMTFIMNEFGNDFVTVLDEDGNELVLEHLGTLNQDDTVYMAFVEAAEEAEDIIDADLELIILRVVEEDGEEVLTSIDDEQEYDTIYELFITELGELYEDEDEEEADDEQLH